jgi:hypothetical protein
LSAHITLAVAVAAGATGYIGSLVVEQLLRTTSVKRIFLLVRGKRGTRGEERIACVLHSGLFHLVRDDPKLLSKVGANYGTTMLAAARVKEVAVPAEMRRRAQQRLHPTV